MDGTPVRYNANRVSATIPASSTRRLSHEPADGMLNIAAWEGDAAPPFDLLRVPAPMSEDRIGNGRIRPEPPSTPHDMVSSLARCRRRSRFGDHILDHPLSNAHTITLKSASTKRLYDSMKTEAGR